MKGYVLIFFLGGLSIVNLAAQGSLLPLGNELNESVRYWDIKYGDSPFILGVKPYARGSIARYAMALDSLYDDETLTPSLRTAYLENNEWLHHAGQTMTLFGKKENGVDSQNSASTSHPNYYTSKKPVLKHLYKTPANFWQVDEPSFYLRLNPIVQFKVWSSNEDVLFLNQRGVEFRGGVDDRIYFYSRLVETQARYATYVRDYFTRYKALPGAGLVKGYKSNFFDIANGYDYLNGQGYVGFNASEHVGLQIGHGRNFLGNGYRSLFLSDFSNNYFYIKINTQFGKFHYQNLYTELAGSSQNATGGSNVLPKKYMVAHYLVFKPRPNLDIGIFEAVVFNRDRYELHYLNPVILYRTVEGMLNSSDNVLLGFDFKWNIKNRFSLYGQLILDEFKFDELFLERNGWWANKFGAQIGTRIIDLLGVPNLIAQVEYNLVRPYTYSHFDSTSNYSHNFQALAHPLGANFKELILSVQYKAFDRLTIHPRFIHAQKGEDNNTLNFGGDILLPNTTRVMEYGNDLVQGSKNTIQIFTVDVSYKIRHNLFVELNYFRRGSTLESAPEQINSYIGGGVRLNVESRRFEF